MPSDDLITRVGRALWGDNWPTEMAHALQLPRDTAHKWQQGKTSPAPSVYADLLPLALARHREFPELVDELREQVRKKT